METKAHSTMHLTDVSMHTMIEIALDRGESSNWRSEWRPQRCPKSPGGPG